MKLNKEQITFIVILLLVGWLAYGQLTQGGGKKPGKKIRGRAQVRDISELETMSAALISDTEPSWTLSGRNIYRAPKEHVPMPPLNLEAPPRPTLVTSSPQTIPGADPYNRIGDVKVVSVVDGVELPPRKEGPNSSDDLGGAEDDLIGEDGEVASSSVDEDETTEEEIIEFAPPGSKKQDEKKDEKKKERQLKKILGLRERLAQDAAEKIEKERKERQKLLDIEERKRTLDKIQWLSGETWYGKIENDDVAPEGSESLDKYEIKIKIDQIRANTAASESELAAKLGDRKLEVEFRRWKDEKWGSSSKLSPLNVRAVEFGEAKKRGDYTVDQFEIDRRLTPMSDVAAHIRLTDKLQGITEFERAKDHLLRLLDAGGKGIELYQALALAANRSFDYNVEMRAVNEGLEKFPKDAVLTAGAAELYSRLGLEELADDLFATAQRLAPRNPLVNARHGRHLVNMSEGSRSKSVEAKQLLEKASQGRFDLEDEKHAVLLDLGSAQLAAGNTDAAQRAFDQVNSVRPDNVRALVGLASVAVAKNDLAAAKERLNDALERSPGTGLVYYNLAFVALAEEQWEQARDHFYDAMNADPFLTARARCGLGYLHERIGKKTEAQAAYAAALEADPESGEVLYWNGRGYNLVGDHQQAFDILRKALAKLPNQFDVLAALSESCFYLGKLDDSLRYVDAAMALRPQSPGLLIRKAQTLVRLKRFDEGKKCLDLSKQQQDSDEVELSLAYYYYLQGNHEEALKRFRSVERSLDRRDDSPLAQYTRRYAEEIADNLAKKVWTDHFNRVATGGDFLRGWRRHAPGSGISASIVDNQVKFSGTQKSSDTPTCIFQRRSGREFVSFEAALTAKKNDECVCGVAILTFRKNVGNQNPFQDPDSGGIAYDGIMVGKTKEGRLGYRLISRYQMGRWQSLPESWPVGESGDAETIVIGIAAEGGKKGTFSILVNSAPVLTGVEVKGLRRTAKDLQLWAFTQAEIDRRLDVKVDDVRIVTKDPKRK